MRRMRCRSYKKHAKHGDALSRSLSSQSSHADVNNLYQTMDEATKAEMKGIINDVLKQQTTNIIQITAANTLRVIDTRLKEVREA